jgi:hypothetical protein
MSTDETQEAFEILQKAVAELTENDSDVTATLLLGYVEMMLDPEAAYDRYTDANGFEDDGATYEMFRDGQKVRCMSYLDADWGYRLISDQNVADADKWRAEHPHDR